MALDELLKGIAVFNQGLQKFATGKAIEGATNKVNELNQQMTQGLIKQEELTQQSQQVSDQLAAKLGALGAPATTIQATAGRFGITAAERVQQERFEKQLNLQKQSLDNQAAERQLRREEAAQIAADKTEDKKNTRVLRQLDIFKKLNKDAIEGVTAGQKALELIKAGNMSTVGPSLAQIGLVKQSGESGKLSDQDLLRAKHDPSLRKEFARWLKLELTGEALKSDVQFYTAVIGALVKKNSERLRYSANNFSKSRAKNIGVDREELLSQLELEMPKGVIDANRSTTDEKTPPAVDIQTLIKPDPTSFMNFIEE